MQVNAGKDAAERLLAGSDEEEVAGEQDNADAECRPAVPVCKDMVHAEICKAMARVLRANDVPPIITGKGGCHHMPCLTRAVSAADFHAGHINSPAHAVLLS